MFQLTAISLSIFIATAVNVFTAYVSWQRRKTKGGIYFSVAMMCVAFWTLAAALDYAAVPIPLKVFFAKLEYLGYHPALSLMTAFSFMYAGHEERLKDIRVRALLTLIPAFGILLAWTNEWHGLLWTSFTPIEGGNNVVHFEHGPGFTWMALSGYLLILMMVANLLQVSITGSALLRRQARLVLAALMVPVASNLLYLFDAFNVPGVDWSSITFSFAGVLFLIALYGSRFMEIIPTARNTLIEQMNDGVLVIDQQARLVDFNPSARSICKLGDDDLWEPLADTRLKNFSEIVSLLIDPSGKTVRDIRIGEKSFNIERIPLADARGAVYGQLAVMRDISERVEQESALRAAQEQLTEQQRAVAVIEERQRLARDLHDSVSQSLHSLTLFSETLTSSLAKPNKERTLQLAERLHETARQALKEARLMLNQLQPSELEAEAGLVQEIEARLSSVEERAGVRAALKVEGDAGQYPLEWREHLFRITIEALNNSLKHAQARNVQVTLHYSDSAVEINVTDDGIGFDRQRARKGGMGMRTMRERANLLGGTLEIRSSPGAGTSVVVRVDKKERP
ncbi:MAG: hypothetical protein HY867_06625 [Chloroflexi bacterium]|nr:hypothetical protein [Chloroflexota bacterium]